MTTPPRTLRAVPASLRGGAGPCVNRLISGQPCGIHTNAACAACKRPVCGACVQAHRATHRKELSALHVILATDREGVVHVIGNMVGRCFNGPVGRGSAEEWAEKLSADFTAVEVREVESLL